MTEDIRGNGDVEGKAMNVEGRRFYQPGVLAAYCILANFPLALFLYGMNVHRRGSNVTGNLIKILAALVMVLMTIALIVEVRFKAFHSILIGIVIGIGLMHAETPHYERAIKNGASAARWWPPLLFLLAQMLFIVAIEFLREGD